ncbi:MAG TPA: hypothetical protein VKH15_11810 [Candidatus Acidoferrum sp.]|nr:hypothetical protein [Candidatus Acidoferrum sp.]
MAEKFVECVELKVPGGGAVREPGLGLLERGGAGADEMDASGAAALNEAGTFEDEQVPGDGWSGDAKRLREDGDGALPALAETD